MKDLMKKNDNGELVRIDHTNTYEGTATLPDGYVIKNKFRCNSKQEAVEQWEAWQVSSVAKNRDRKKALEDKKQSARNEQNVKNLIDVLERIADALELIALRDDKDRVVEVQAEEPKKASEKKNAEDGLTAFIESRSAYEFINCTSTSIHKTACEYCAANGYELPTQQLVTRKVKQLCADVLTWTSTNHGTTFYYKGAE